MGENRESVLLPRPAQELTLTYNSGLSQHHQKGEHWACGIDVQGILFSAVFNFQRELSLWQRCPF